MDLKVLLYAVHIHATQIQTALPSDFNYILYASFRSSVQDTHTHTYAHTYVLALLAVTHIYAIEVLLLEAFCYFVATVFAI